MERKKYNNQKRNQVNNNTIISQTSNTSINNTSISTPNISLINPNQNKTPLIKSNSSLENSQIKILNNNDKIKLILSNSSNKKKISSIPFRKNKYNKKFINSKSLKNNNNINENSNFLNNSYESKNESKNIQEDQKTEKTSFDNQIIEKIKDNINITPYKNKNKRLSFSFLNTELRQEDMNTNNNERKIIRSKTKK